jgi:hypothetical protein
MTATSPLARAYTMSAALPPAQAELVYLSAKRNGNSLSAELREALAPYLERLEAQAEARAAGPDPSIPGDGQRWHRAIELEAEESGLLEQLEAPKTDA